MISRRTSSVAKDGFPRQLYTRSICSQTCGRLSQACGQHSQVLPDLYSALADLLLALPGAPRLVLPSQTCHWLSQVFSGSPEGHCIGPGNSGIWPPGDSGPTILRHSQRLPVTKIYCADVYLQLHLIIDIPVAVMYSPHHHCSCQGHGGTEKEHMVGSFWRAGCWQ